MAEAPVSKVASGEFARLSRETKSSSSQSGSWREQPGGKRTAAGRSCLCPKRTFLLWRQRRYTGCGGKAEIKTGARATAAPARGGRAKGFTARGIGAGALGGGPASACRPRDRPAAARGGSRRSPDSRRGSIPAIGITGQFGARLEFPATVRTTGSETQERHSPVIVIEGEKFAKLAKHGPWEVPAAGFAVILWGTDRARELYFVDGAGGGGGGGAAAGTLVGKGTRRLPFASRLSVPTARRARGCSSVSPDAQRSHQNGPLSDLSADGVLGTHHHRGRPKAPIRELLARALARTVHGKSPPAYEWVLRRSSRFRAAAHFDLLLTEHPNAGEWTEIALAVAAATRSPRSSKDRY